MVEATKKGPDEIDFVYSCRHVNTTSPTGGDVAQMLQNANSIMCALAFIDHSELDEGMLVVYADTKKRCIQTIRAGRKLGTRKGAAGSVIAQYKKLRTLSVYLFGSLRPNLTTAVETLL